MQRFEDFVVDDADFGHWEWRPSRLRRRRQAEQEYFRTRRCCMLGLGDRGCTSCSTSLTKWQSAWQLAPSAEVAQSYTASTPKGSVRTTRAQCALLASSGAPTLCSAQLSAAAIHHELSSNAARTVRGPQLGSTSGRSGLGNVIGPKWAISEHRMGARTLSG